MSFTEQEIAYLRSQPLARLATADLAAPEVPAQPDVVPVALEYDGEHLWVGGGERSVLGTRKFRNVATGAHQVAVVVDDLPSFEPFIARGIRIYGRAAQPFQRTGMVGPGWFLRITPTVSWSWNLDGEPVGENWYETRRTVH